MQAADFTVFFYNKVRQMVRGFCNCWNSAGTNAGIGWNRIKHIYVLRVKLIIGV